MTPRDLVARSLQHYWRTNAAVALGVGVAVAALAGALVVGDSVRASLRELALSRLGRADQVVTATNLFTEQLAERIASSKEFSTSWTGAVPVLALEGVLTHERSATRAGNVQVFGVDDHFWTFHGVSAVRGPAGREAYVSPALARELGASSGDALLLRVQKPSAIPAAVIQGRRDEPGRAIRLSVARVLSPGELGEFSPRPQQGEVRTLFVPLERLQRDLELPHRVNLVLMSSASPTGPDPEAVTRLVETKTDLADLGIRLRPVDQALAIESDAGLLNDVLASGVTAAAQEIGATPVPMMTYLATAIRANGRETPYSLVASMPEDFITRNGGAPRGASEGASPGPDKPVWLTQWTADDLGAHPGDRVTLEYYLWSDQDGLTTASSEFTVAGVMPMTGLAIDQDLTPDYPGMSTSPSIADWDPPFPVNLQRIRPKDEDYWRKYRVAPKAIIRLEDGQQLWRSRYGQLTSMRVLAGDRSVADLHTALRDPLARHVPASAAGFRVTPVRANALAAASGTTDFGEYFTYFSFFLVVSSLLLTLLFFRLGIEQRAHEVGVLAAMGYTARAIRGLLLAEGAVLATVGAALGVVGALAYSALIMLALRTLWVDAVGTTALAVHVSLLPLVAGGLVGIAAGLACIAWSLRVLRAASTRQLMSGAWVDASTLTPRPSRRTRQVALAALILALVLAGVGVAGGIPPAGAFFGSGTLLLIAGLSAVALWLRGTSRRTFVSGAWPLAQFGLRNARYRPARSVLSVALIAAATFLIVSIGAFRLDADDSLDPKSATGGYALIAETVAPLMHDPSTPAGREALNFKADAPFSVARFRLRPGDDASCLNLYRPQSPRLLGAPDEFVRANRFTFSASMADADAERQNPWLLLNRRFEDGAVPVVGDSTSLTYVFHLGVGDDYVMQGPDGRPLRLRIAGALRDSVLQSELIIGDANFTRLFPRNEGFRVFLIATDPSRAAALGSALEEQLQDFGMDAQSISERLASYHRVQNTYLSTFQALGALGLVLGTLGLGTVLLRNVLERKRELALLQATGYRRSHLVLMVIAESVFLLACGLSIGIACAAVAIAPAYLERDQAFPVLSTLGLLAAVFAAGMLSTIMATRVVATSELLPALKNE